MSYGELGSLIIRENWSSGDGALDIMIPGQKRSVIFCIIQLQNYIVATDVL